MREKKIGTELTDDTDAIPTDANHIKERKIILFLQNYY